MGALISQEIPDHILLPSSEVVLRAYRASHLTTNSTHSFHSSQRTNSRITLARALAKTSSLSDAIVSLGESTIRITRYQRAWIRTRDGLFTDRGITRDHS